MSAQAKKIRNAVVAYLKGRTPCGDRVFENRVRTLWNNEFPCISVYTESESVSLWAEAGPREYQRRLIVRCEIIDKADEDIDDRLDDLGEIVERLMHQDHVLGPKSGFAEELVEDIILTDRSYTLDSGAETVFGSLILSFEMPYYTLPVRDLDLDKGSADHVQVQWDIAENASGNIDATDTITGLYDQ